MSDLNTNQQKPSNAFDRYQEAAARTANHDHAAIIKRLQENPHFIELANYGLGVVSEAAEISDLIKKIVFHGHELDQAAVDKILKECGDDIWYLSNITRILKTKLSTVAGMNIEKLKKRYPDGFDQQKSINREE